MAVFEEKYIGRKITKYRDSLPRFIRMASNYLSISSVIACPYYPFFPMIVEKINEEVYQFILSQMKYAKGK